MLAIPILFFAFIKSLIDNLALFADSVLFWPLIMGFISSFITGYFVIDVLVRMIEKQRLWYFSIYCLFISLMLGFYYGI